MGIMDFFNKAVDTAAPQVQVAQAAPAPTAPPAKMPGTDQGAQDVGNPLDAYTKLWEKDNKATADSGPPSFNLDPKVLDEVSGGLDFMAGVPQDLMQQAQTGDIKAIMALMQHSTRNAYKAAMHHNTALTDKYFAARSAHDLKGVHNQVKTELTQSALSTLPNADHPAVKHQLSMVAEQMRAQNPDASPQAIAEAAKKYVMDLANALNPKAAETTKIAAEDDWEKYING